MRLFWAALFSFFFIPCSASYAFDCSNIKLPSTAVICSDVCLMAMGDQRQLSYKKALRIADATQKKALAADQLGWVRTYSASCGAPRDKPVLSPITKEMRLCFRSAGWSRIAYLESYGFDIDMQRLGMQPGLMSADTWAEKRDPVWPSAPAARQTDPVPTPTPALALDSFPAMDRDTGCHSNYSRERKADLFAQKYQDRVMTLRGKISTLEQSRIGPKVLPSTISSDIYIELADPKAGYNLTKGASVVVQFTMRTAGGCFTTYDGDSGVIVDGGN